MLACNARVTANRGARHVTSLATKIAEKPSPDTQKQETPSYLAGQIAAEVMAGSGGSFRVAEQNNSTAMCAVSCDTACTLCPAYNLLCGGMSKDAVGGVAPLPVSGTMHTIPARRLIQHPKEWSEFVPIVCSGWAMSSIALPDGRRQVISFLLPGDIVSIGSLLAPLSGHTVEAITEVTYRKFKRQEIKELLFGRSDLLERLFTLWNEAKARADQLALDLGRRRADERIARLILRLSEKVAKRSLVRTQTFDFPLRQRHIADATGLTPVHVSKILGELQRAGMIEINGRSLTILNGSELQRVADWR
ncbi:Crp/Fnr family transcriptional regulator [Pseudolabrys sp. Root1462]|uniref:Crp/Fnr family transcriptional regulator n=1 Tax=Pseudolabrys sp. Root1462 TaxID=1736466 RepID=UPI0012E33F24|nr:Crp/Fnr family transcriptional regulator [Pseudolabrys sp. Root1462]